MRFLPKRHFRWREPEAFVKLHGGFKEASSWSWWMRPLIFLVIAAGIMTNWYLATLDSLQTPAPFGLALAGALAAGVLVPYFLPWFESRLASFCPTEIQFWDKELYRVRVGSQRRLKYSEIAAFTWRVGGDFATLILHLHKGKPDWLVGVPPEVSRDAVSQFLLDRQIPGESGA